MTALLLLFAFGWARADTVRVTVFHTNDIHGHIAPEPARDVGKDPKRLIGGLAALANAVRAEKGPKLVLDAGDWFQGTPEGTLTQGEVMAEGFNAVGYDAVELGNHDFDLGQDKLRGLVRRLKAPVLGANVYDAKTGARADFAKPFVIKEVAGVKIGIFGLLTAGMRILSLEENIRGLRFEREVDEARKVVAELKRQGATVIIAVSHVGFEDPKRKPFEGERFLAANVPGIDLIVGGHSHNTAFHEPFRDPANGTLVVIGGVFLKHVGKVDLEIDRETGRVKSSTGRLIPLWADEFGQAPDLAAIVERYSKTVSERLAEKVGEAAEPLAHDCTASEETPGGDWVSDCVRAWAGVDIGFYNTCGIRSRIEAGPVTLRKIFELIPFDNVVSTMTLTGAQVRELLEESVDDMYGVSQVSGLSFHYLGKGEKGRKVRSVQVGGRPLDAARSYTLATNDFLVQGGEGFTVFLKGAGNYASGVLVRDVLADCARKGSPIKAPPHDRIFKE